jgi:hypothetical protein
MALYNPKFGVQNPKDGVLNPMHDVIQPQIWRPEPHAWGLFQQSGHVFDKFCKKKEFWFTARLCFEVCFINCYVFLFIRFYPLPLLDISLE